MAAFCDIFSVMWWLFVKLDWFISSGDAMIIQNSCFLSSLYTHLQTVLPAMLKKKAKL